MKSKFIVIFLIVMIFVAGCGFKTDYLSIPQTNDFLGTWYSTESWSGSYDGVSDQYCGKYVFTESTVSFYTYGISSSSSWTLRNSYPCTYNYDFVYRDGSEKLYAESFTFGGVTYNLSTFNSLSASDGYYSSFYVDMFTIDNKKYAKPTQSTEVTPTNDFLGTWQYNGSWQVSSSYNSNTQTYSYLCRMGKYEFSRSSVKYYTKDYTSSTSYPSSSSFSSISWSLNNTYSPAYSCKLYANGDSSSNWSGVYKVDSCTFDGHSYNVLDYNTSAEHINVDNKWFYKQ